MDPDFGSPFLDPMSLEASFPSSPEDSSPNSSFSEKELALSGEAHRSFAEGRYSEATAALTNLRQTRPDDPLVRLNLVVAKFRGQSGRRDLDMVKEELESIFRQITAGNDFEEVDHVVLIYNLAVVYFLRKQLLKAEQLVRKLHPSVTSSSQGEDFARSLLSLLTALALALNMPTQALGYVAEQEKLQSAGAPKSPDQILNRAQAMVLLKQHKNFKRDLKSNSDFSTEEAVAFEFLRANLEYLRGNHRKAQKLLSLSVQNGKLDKPPCSSNMLSLFQNNCGCINMMMNKRSLAAYYFAQALHSHIEAVKATAFANKLDLLLQIRKYEILYNLGLSLLHGGEIEKSFQVLLQALPMLRGNPHFWLHLSECCIAYCSRRGDNMKDLQRLEIPANAKGKQQLREPIDVSFRCVGQGNNQKLILANLNEKKKMTSSSCELTPSNPTLSLPFASVCLATAASLMDLMAPNGPSQNQPASSKVTLVRAAILLKQSFVALSLDNHSLAVKHAQELMSLNSVPGGYLALGRLYLGEALIFLDRISEATSVLDPKTVSDVSFTETREEDGNSSLNTSGGGGIKKSGSSVGVVGQPLELHATKALFSYNLIVAYLMRGELDKADDMIDFLWANRHTHRIGTRVFTAKLYVQLKKGNIKACRDMIRQNCAVISTFREKVGDRE